MSELSRTVVPFPLPLNPPQTPPAPLATDRPLPRLDSAPDARFLHYEPHVAGRAVVLELYAPEHATAVQRVALWKRVAKEEGVYLAELGLCAQALERAGVNWRQAVDIDEIIRAARRLTAGTIAD